MDKKFIILIFVMIGIFLIGLFIYQMIGPKNTYVDNSISIGDICKNEDFTNCVKEISCDGKSVLVKGYIDAEKVYEDKFILVNDYGGKAGDLKGMSVEVFYNNTNGLYEELQNEAKKGNLIVIQARVDVVSIATMNTCDRSFILRLTKIPKIL